MDATRCTRLSPCFTAGPSNPAGQSSSAAGMRRFCRSPSAANRVRRLRVGRVRRRGRGGASMWTLGRIRLSQRGIHQLRSPSSSIVAGTSSIRTMVASISTAMERPRPNSLTTRSDSPMKLPKTTTMIAAAAVITRAVEANPSATEARLSPVRSHSSRTRDKPVADKNAECPEPERHRTPGGRHWYRPTLQSEEVGICHPPTVSTVRHELTASTSAAGRRGTAHTAEPERYSHRRSQPAGRSLPALS